jgi:uncharacterized membrane protein
MTRTYWAVAIGLTALAWAASIALYPGLPAKIPTHWNFRGEIDAYGSKSWGAFLLPGVMTGLLALVGFLPALSPRNFAVDSFRSTYLFVLVLVQMLFGYIHGLSLYAAASGRVDVGRALIGGMLLVLALLGNVLGKVRRNFYIGVRTPWTLASDRVWNDTHRLAAWLMVLGSLAGLVLTVAGASLIAPLAIVMASLLAPAFYSFVHYKRLERRGEV